MSLACGHSIKHRLCLGLAVSSVCLGCSSSSTSDGGQAGSGAGGAHAGAGGAARGGTGGSSGGSGGIGQGGKDRECEVQECFAANTCLTECGGTVVYVGCCPCQPPAVNDFTCTGTD